MAAGDYRIGLDGKFHYGASGAVPPQEKALAAAKSGTLSTRTSDTAGTLTLAAGHGITDGDTIDVFWTDANGVLKCAYGATVGTVAGNEVPFTGASGDALPDQGTAITAQKPTELDCDFDGDKAVLLVAMMKTSGGHVTFVDSGDAVLKGQTLQANEPFLWWKNGPFAAPVTGNPVDAVLISNAGTAAATFQLTGLVDSDT